MDSKTKEQLKKIFGFVLGFLFGCIVYEAGLSLIKFSKNGKTNVYEPAEFTKSPYGYKKHHVFDSKEFKCNNLSNDWWYEIKHFDVLIKDDNVKNFTKFLDNISKTPICLFSTPEFIHTLLEIKRNMGLDMLYKMSFDEILEKFVKEKQQKTNQIKGNVKKICLKEKKKFFIAIALFRYAIGLSVKSEILRVADLLCAIESIKQFCEYEKKMGRCQYNYNKIIAIKKEKRLSDLIYDNKTLDGLYLNTLKLWDFLLKTESISLDFIQNLLKTREDEIKQIMYIIRTKILDFPFRIKLNEKAKNIVEEPTNNDNGVLSDSETLTAINLTVRNIKKMFKEHIYTEKTINFKKIRNKNNINADDHTMKKIVFAFNLLENLSYFINNFKTSDIYGELTKKQNYTRNNFEVLSKIFLYIIKTQSIKNNNNNFFGTVLEDFTLNAGLSINYDYTIITGPSFGINNLFSFVFCTLCNVSNEIIENLSYSRYKNTKFDYSFEDMWDKKLTRKTPFSNLITKIKENRKKWSFLFWT